MGGNKGFCEERDLKMYQRVAWEYSGNVEDIQQAEITAVGL